MSLKVKSGQDPDNFGTVIAALEIEYWYDFEEKDKTATLVGAAGPLFANRIISKTKRLENNNEEVTCDDLTEAMCEHWRMSGKRKVVVEDYKPSKTSLINP